MSAPYVKGSETSKAAAEEVHRIRPGQQRVIFDYVEARGAVGATDQEIEIGTGLNSSSVRPRRGELAASGFLSAAPFTRPTTSGYKAVVWWARRDIGRQMDLL